MRDTRRNPTVGCSVHLHLAHARRLLRGVQHAAESRGWRLVLLPQGADLAPALRASRPDGVIAHLGSRADARIVAAYGAPAVNVSGLLDGLAMPRVGIDDDAVGRLAARHFLERGLRRLACLRDDRHAASRRRVAAFRAEAALAGADVAVRVATSTRDAMPDASRAALDAGTRRWLARLPRPCGLFAWNDVVGLVVGEACRQVGARVPEDVALVGVDDDDLLCGLARPPLSSVALPSEALGARAIELLARIMARGAPPARPLLLAPLGIAARRSSDLVAIDDPAVRAFACRLRDDGPSLAALAAAARDAGVSRRTVERRVRAVLGRSPAAEVRRLAVERAKRILVDTALPMGDVAARAGFASAKRLSLVFRRLAGTTPSAWRRSSGAARR